MPRPVLATGASRENHSKAFAIIDYVASYNATHPNAPIRGFQFDVESYLLPSYDNDKAGTLTKFVSLVAETAAHMSGMNCALPSSFRTSTTGPSAGRRA